MIRFRSTRSSDVFVPIEEAITAGLAPDGGLFVPDSFPEFATSEVNSDFTHTAEMVLRPFFSGSSLEKDLDTIVKEAFNFPVPLRFYAENTASLELFHGPTAAFKDFGARFLSGVMEKLGRSELTTIIVATSGDTGGAVASAFYGKKATDVIILFPLGKVSDRQAHQLTCWGGNIHSYAVKGTFDDCQAMAKEAFRSSWITDSKKLSSANSINLGRLLPQTTYYFHATVQFQRETGQKPIIIVPSGNVGNAAGAFWAKKMGAPIRKIVLATNNNRTITDYFKSGNWNPAPSIETLANAMDVGNPSNMERLFSLLPNQTDMKNHFDAYSVSDEEIRETIINHYKDYGVEICPHTAVAERVRIRHFQNEPVMIVATAHPAKFETIVEPLTGRRVELPESLQSILTRKSAFSVIEPDLRQVFTE